MTKEMEFFLFLIERYAKAKGRMTGDVLREWDEKGMKKVLPKKYLTDILNIIRKGLKTLMMI